MSLYISVHFLTSNTKIYHTNNCLPTQVKTNLKITQPLIWLGIGGGNEVPSLTDFGWYANRILTMNVIKLKSLFKRMYSMTRQSIYWLTSVWAICLPPGRTENISPLLGRYFKSEYFEEEKYLKVLWIDNVGAFEMCF